MRAALLLLVACGGSPTHPAAPANRGGTPSPTPAHELRLDVTPGPSDIPIDPLAPIDLVVVSKIAGVEVLVDGKVVGVTPVRVRVPAGRHVVRTYAAGY